MVELIVIELMVIELFDGRTLKVNNASRTERVLKFIRVVGAICKYFCLLVCHLAQPRLTQKVVLVIN